MASSELSEEERALCHGRLMAEVAPRPLGGWGLMGGWGVAGLVTYFVRIQNQRYGRCKSLSEIFL